MKENNILQKERFNYSLKRPNAIKDLTKVAIVSIPIQESDKEIFAAEFPLTSHLPKLYVGLKTSQGQYRKLRVAALFSGGQAPGGHNVIAALFDGVKELNPESELFGFLNGPTGLINGQYIPITKDLIDGYRNLGGFDLIGSGRTKIESEEQFAKAANVARALCLDGLVIIGGDDSNTNAAFLAEYFLRHQISTSVIGVPKTIDGDLKNRDIEISFGFDSATKTYSEIIGNILRDALSAKKYYFFIKMMGRAASHIALECALQTQPNLTLIGEEIFEKKMTLKQICTQIADIICKRAEKGKDYGVILIPEGVIEFIPEFKELIKEMQAIVLNEQLNTDEKISQTLEKLSEPSKRCFLSIPAEIQKQLMLERDPHGNIPVSKIETERLLIECVESELKNRKLSDDYKGSFNPQPLFCGYEGRACYPSNFDASYCYALGLVASLLINHRATGYLASLKGLRHPVDQWEPFGIPLVSMMHLEERKGKWKPVVKKALVDLESAVYKAFEERRDSWLLDDHYLYPGPIQFFGPKELTDSVPYTLM